MKQIIIGLAKLCDDIELYHHNLPNPFLLIHRRQPTTKYFLTGLFDTLKAQERFKLYKNKNKSRLGSQPDKPLEAFYSPKSRTRAIKLSKRSLTSSGGGRAIFTTNKWAQNF